MTTPEQDREHLNLLSIFHWVVAGLAALSAFFPVFHLLVGVLLVSGRDGAARGEPVARLIGLFFVLFACTWIVAGLVFASCLAIAGRYLGERRHRTYCLVMAGISCAFFPFGTVLGVCTILVLSRESVRSSFRDGPATAPAEVVR